MVEKADMADVVGGLDRPSGEVDVGVEVEVEIEIEVVDDAYSLANSRIH